MNVYYQIITTNIAPKNYKYLTQHVCFPRSPQGFPLQAFLPIPWFHSNICSTCAVTVVIFGHFFCLLSYLLPGYPVNTIRVAGTLTTLYC